MDQVPLLSASDNNVCFLMSNVNSNSAGRSYLRVLLMSCHMGALWWAGSATS